MSTLNLPHTAEGFTIARAGAVLGTFSAEEIELIIARQDGGLLLTDHIFDPDQQKWLRLSEAILESRKPKPAPPAEPLKWKEFAVGLVLIALLFVVIVRVKSGDWIWNMQ